MREFEAKLKFILDPNTIPVAGTPVFDWPLKTSSLPKILVAQSLLNVIQVFTVGELTIPVSIWVRRVVLLFTRLYLVRYERLAILT